MATELGCVGMAVADLDELLDLLARIADDAVLRGCADDLETFTWTDMSGARLTVSGSDQRGIVDVTASCAGETGARLAGVTALTGAVVAADLVDEDGSLATRAACELLQARFLTPGHASGRAAITALGTDVTVHEDACAFARAPQSLLLPPDGAGPAGESTARVGAESFFSYGLFADDAGTTGHGRLAGTVLHSGTRTNTLTGQSFHVVRVRSVGMTADLCLDLATHPRCPQPGNVVSGVVLLVASMDQLWPAATRGRRWWRRR
ncbi:hypothetical protein ACT8ZV_22005 [Nocardioides sp. MAHUQ-72]|uniref:hypothetical protein n=1 Tax=unclassified Nocardioides TaxID=2615069 RepID=UPI00361A5E8B